MAADERSAARSAPPAPARPRRPRGPTPPPPSPGWRVNPAPDGRGARREPPQQQRPRVSWWLVGAILGALLLNYVLAAALTGPEPRPRVPYSPFFLDQVRAGNVESITSTGSALQGRFRKAVQPPAPAPADHAVDKFKTEIPSFANTDQLFALLRSKDVVVNAQPLDQGASWWATLLLGFGPTLLFIVLMVWLFRRAGSMMGGGALGGLGRSRARRYEGTEQRVTFDDVAGIDEAKAELTEIVDALRNPDRYRRLGARIPRGVLLSGQPGTGKTLLARAVAGEAGVPFFSMSASEFVEMIVGVGASRVRDLFASAKAAAPAIVFIDELDAIGRSRSASVGGFSGGHDEREQTLNQILTEMDGFDAATGVIVLGATNRPDVLDQALLRPGRFDRRVAVQPPDLSGRRKILQVHSRSLPLAGDVDLEALAASTPGMVGADLANLANEAALVAARRGRDRVHQADFTDALERIVLGAERKIVLSREDRRRTAYHEAGHAIVGMLTPGADPVRKVSIIPRGMALGVTFASPVADRFSYDEGYMRGKIKVLLGGRVAEELVYGEVTTGAESDIQQLTQVARQMVGRWGMSREVGPIAVLPTEGRNPLLPGADEPSEETQRLVDREVRRIVESAHGEVTRLLDENRGRLDALVEALLRDETLDEADAYAAAGVERHHDAA